MVLKACVTGLERLGNIMFRLQFLTLFMTICTVVSSTAVLAEEARGDVYLEIMRDPPNRHVIAMASMEECERAAEYSNARCVVKLPQLPDSSVGVLRAPGWEAKPFYNTAVPLLKGKDYGPVYLVVRRSPPNRHVIAMDSMSECLDAIAYSSAECIEKLPELPDASVGVLRTLKSSNY